MSSRPPTPEETVAKFAAKVDMSGRCWLWTAYRNRRGYGWFRDGQRGKAVLAHRWAYEGTFGEIPEGLFVIHSCDTPACVKPSHLRIGTAADNAADMVRRGRAVNLLATRHAAKTHCAQGHEYSPENTYHYKKRGRPARGCRACYKMRHTQRRLAKKINSDASRKMSFAPGVAA